MDHRLASLSFILLATACSGPKSNKPSPDALPAPDGAANTVVSCPASISGGWTMTSVACGGTDVTSDIKGQGGISQMLMAIGDTGSSCRITNTNSGPTCAETEQLELVANPDGSYTIVPVSGIASCQPAACTFNANDAPCAIGDRADPNLHASMQLVGGNLAVTSQPPAGLCASYGVATVVTYQKS